MSAEEIKRRENNPTAPIRLVHCLSLFYLETLDCCNNCFIHEIKFIDDNDLQN